MESRVLETNAHFSRGAEAVHFSARLGQIMIGMAEPSRPMRPHARFPSRPEVVTAGIGWEYEEAPRRPGFLALGSDGDAPCLRLLEAALIAGIATWRAVAFAPPRRAPGPLPRR
jgi:hypothetical protein